MITTQAQFDQALIEWEIQNLPVADQAKVRASILRAKFQEQDTQNLLIDIANEQHQAALDELFDSLS